MIQKLVVGYIFFRIIELFIVKLWYFFINER